ncbi:MAG: hypothetical protein M3Y17_09465 [Actinomycetota bacterium]|nr:hypothetical protein [Actinomycetota bacterium]
MTLEGRLADSRLPAADDPSLWIEGRQMIVSSSWGVESPGAWIGVHANAVDKPIPGEFEFRIEVAEVDALGQPTSIVQQRSLRTSVSNEPTELLERDAHPPAAAPAWYRIRTSVSQDAFSAERRAYITVPAQVLEAELVPARKRGRPGDKLNTGPTDLFFGVEYRLEREESGKWTCCNVEEAWNCIGLYLEPGGRWRDAATLPEDAPPGRYRVSKDVDGIGTNLMQTVSFEFHVAEE